MVMHEVLCRFLPQLLFLERSGFPNIEVVVEVTKWYWHNKALIVMSSRFTSFSFFDVHVNLYNN